MKTKFKIQQYFKRILCTIILVVLLFPSVKSNAAVTKEQAGAAIASFSIDFYNKYGSRVQWYDVILSDPSSYGKRAAAYNEATVGSMETYYMDCVGWVSYAIHHATGLDDSGPSSGRGSFVAPGGAGAYFDDVTGSDLQPGDILSNSHHVLVYVGDNKVIDSRGNGLTYTTLEEYGNVNYTRASYGPGANGVYDQVFRINDAGANLINESDLAPIISGLNSDSKKKKDYNYYGLPSKGGYTGSKGTWNKVINLLSQIADYLIGLMTLGIKIELIGWTTIFENLVTDVINEVTGTELEAADAGAGGTEETGTSQTSTQDSESLYTPDATETVTGFFTDKNDRLTVEKIIYNQVPIFDVNIFNTEEAGGQTLNPDGTLATIKKNIAKWYYVFRNISIIGLLLVLLYIGIRMAISTAASEKAQYKRYLKDWIVSFIIVFCIHYIMIFILNVNEYLVELMKNTSGSNETFLYETVRTKAYELKFTSGIAGTIMYMILVYLLIRYIFIYAKRYLTINILAIIAPIIGITYSIDKLKDNKSQSLGAWLKDFTFTVLLQTVHALLYTMFIPIALETSEDGISGIIFAFILLNFMTKADKIVINIFGMNKGKGFGNVVKDDVRSLFVAFTGAKAVGKFYSTGFRLAGGAIKGVGRTAGQIGGIVIPTQTRYKFNNWYNNTTDKVLGENNFLNKRRTNDIKTVSGIDSKISAKKQEYRRALKTQIAGPFKFAKNGIKFTLGSMVAIPALIVAPGEGVKRTLRVLGTSKLVNASAESAKLKAPKTGRGSLNRIVTRRTKAGNNDKDSKKLGIAGRAVQGAKNARMNSVTTAATLQGRFSKSINMLEEAKSLEESIITGYSGLKQSVNDRLSGGKTPAASKLPGAILAKLDTQYDKMIEDIFKEVDQGDITAAVQDFTKQQKTTKIQSSDMDKLVTMLQAKLDKKKDNNIKISKPDVTSNIEETIEESVNDRLARGIETVLKKNDVSMEGIDQKKQKNIAKDIKKILAKTDDEQSIFDAIDQSLADNNITTNIDNNTKKQIVENLKRRIENEQDKVFTPNEIIGIIKKSLDKKGSIETEAIPTDFKDIAEDMQKLKELNSQYGKDFGEKIFDKEEIISAMKKTKEAKKFDLYDSIINGEK